MFRFWKRPRPKVVCDICGKKFKMRVKNVKLAGGLEKVYFTCPKCKTEYISFCTDDNIRAKQERLRYLLENYNMACDKGDTDQAKKLFGLWKDLKTEILQDIDKLKASVLERSDRDL